MLCRFCESGKHEEIKDFQSDGFVNPKDRRHCYRCPECGHLESFLFRDGTLPKAWK